MGSGRRLNGGFIFLGWIAAKGGDDDGERSPRHG